MASVRKEALKLTVVVLSLAVLCSCKTANYAFKQLDFTKEAPDGTIYHRPLAVTTFSYPEDQKVILFCNLFNYGRTYQIDAIWTTPANQIFKRQHCTQNQMSTAVDGRKHEGFYKTFDLPTSEIKDYPGKWKVEILIDGKLAKTKYFTLVSKGADRQQATASSGQASPQKGTDPSATSPESISVTGLTLTKQLGAMGVTIAEVKPGSSAYEAGLRRGNVIREINQQAVQDLSDYSRALSRAKKEEPLLLKIKRGESTMLVSVKVPWTNSKETAQSHYNNGNELFEAKKYREAITSYKKAIEIEAGFAPLFYNLAMAQMAVGENQEAARNLKRYLEIRPNADNAIEVKQMLKSLGK